MNETITSESYRKLFKTIYDLYHTEENKNKLLFHGWHHIQFVHDKSIEFAQELNANVTIVASAVLVHDLNYIFTEKLEPEAANLQIKEHLIAAGFAEDEVSNMLAIIESAHTGHRANAQLSDEAKALSDADTLFKALPITPILFASKFITENKYDIRKLANKVVGEQEPLILSDQYFFTQLAKDKYSKWANANLQIWKNVLEALDDKAVSDMLQTAEELGVL